MPGQAIVTIGQKSWEVYLATTPQEVVQGLSGLSSIPEGTGMFFDTGAEQLIQITTENMQFPIDIAFISSNMQVVDIIQHFQPGNRIIASAPARYFLEVNAGELDGVNRGDTVTVNVFQAAQQQMDMNTIFTFMVAMMMMWFMYRTMLSMVRGKARPRALPPGYRRIPGRRLLAERPRRQRLPQTKPERYALTQLWYRNGVDAGKTETWMNVEDTLDETRQAHPELIHDYHSLVQADMDLWEETDHFEINYGSRMMDDAKEATKTTEDMIDLYLELKDQFWKGYIEGRKEKGIDIYQKAREMVRQPGRQPQTYMPQTKRQDVVTLPFAGAIGRQMWWVATVDSKTVTVQVTGARRLSDRQLEGAFADSEAIVNKDAIGHKGLPFAMAGEDYLKWLDLVDGKLVGVTVLGVGRIPKRTLEDAFSSSKAMVEGTSPQYLPAVRRRAKFVPNLPEGATEDPEFLQYLGVLAASGIEVTDSEARRLWEEWKRLPPEQQFAPQTKVSVYCPICGKEIDVGRYDSITRTEALREHIQEEHREQRERQRRYLPQTKETTRLNGLRILKAYKQVSRHGEDQICVKVQAWGIFPRGKKPHLIHMYRSGDVYVIRPLYAHISEPVRVSVKRVKQWIRSLPVRHFKPMEVAPENREVAERLARQVDEMIQIVPLSEQPQYQAQTTQREQLAGRILEGLKGKGENYLAYVKCIPGQAFATIGSIIGGHYSWNPQGFSIWVDAWEKDKSTFGGIREIGRGQSFPATEKGVKQALDYVEERFPNYTTTRWVTNSIPIYVAQAVGIEVPQERIPRLPQTLPNLTREDVTVDAWQERDRLGIWVTDKHTDKVIAEWWDEDARELFEQGFFKGGVPQYSWEKPGPEFVKSVLDYLEDIGVLAKEEEGPAGPPVPERKGQFKLHEDPMGNIILEYSEEPDKDVLLQFEADKAVVYDILTDEEQEELRSGWEVQVPAAKPRASVLEELWQYAEPKNMPQTQRPGLWKTPLNIDLDKKEIAHISKDLLKKGTPICRVNPHERWPKARYGTDVGIVFRVEEPVQRDTIVHGETDYIIGLASFKTLLNRRPDLLSLPMCAEGSSRTKRAPSTAQTRSYPMPKLPKEARSDTEFVNYVRMIVQAGESLTDREARALWQKWKQQKKQTRQTSQRYYPAVIKDALSRGRRFVSELPDEAKDDVDFLIALGILDASGKRVTGEMARNLWEQWKSLPREQRAISPVAQTKTGGGQARETRLIPTDRRKREKSELKYFADSPEFLTQTVDLTGYREQIDKAFQEAIRRVKGTK